jgi:hypothetical protein
LAEGGRDAEEQTEAADQPGHCAFLRRIESTMMITRSPDKTVFEIEPCDFALSVSI